jgi:hypothetical protein
MAKTPANRQTASTGDEPVDSSLPTSSRLAVHISPTTKAAIDRVVERESVTQTEAVRRLIGYGDLIYRTTHIDEHEVLIRRGETLERIVLI